MGKLIIDTDPGVDDVLGLLLALSKDDKDIDLALISICFGNVETSISLRNVIAMFDVLKIDEKYRKENGIEIHSGYEKVLNNEEEKKIILAVGANGPLEGGQVNADYFHGLDGLGNVTQLMPEYAVSNEKFDDIWSRVNNDGQVHLFAAAESEPNNYYDDCNEPYILSSLPSHKEILKVLQENPIDSVTIAAIGPLTNIALAAIEDPKVFNRVKRVISMGGCINVPGNITPVGEFNVYADPYAAAIVYSLSGKYPIVTLPPFIQVLSDVARKRLIEKNPKQKQLNLVLFPLDITSIHLMTHQQIKYNVLLKRPYLRQSPLYKWVYGFLESTFEKVESLYNTQDREPGLEMHDPLVLYYALNEEKESSDFETIFKDVRIETQGQWTRGECVIDNRSRTCKPKHIDPDIVQLSTTKSTDSWLHGDDVGNHISIAINSKISGDGFSNYLLDSIF